jgi:hypothetical protein
LAAQFEVFDLGLSIGDVIMAAYKVSAAANDGLLDARAAAEPKVMQSTLPSQPN